MIYISIKTFAISNILFCLIFGQVSVTAAVDVKRISKSEIDEIVVTDTIPLSAEAQDCGKIRQLSISELLAETIRRISEEESVSSLYLE